MVQYPWAAWEGDAARDISEQAEIETEERIVWRWLSCRLSSASSLPPAGQNGHTLLR
jgi:hypothetical protein